MPLLLPREGLWDHPAAYRDRNGMSDDMKSTLDRLGRFAARRERTNRKLDQEELELIEAARKAGASWDRIAQRLGIRTRQGAQQRHAALARSTSLKRE